MTSTLAVEFVTPERTTVTFNEVTASCTAYDGELNWKIAIGAGVGAGSGALIGHSKGYWDDERAVYALAGALIGSGVGAATGYIFGMTRRNRQLVYQQ